MSLRFPLFLTATVSALVMGPLGADAVQPEGYYAGIEGKVGGQLRNALHDIIRKDWRNGAEQHFVIEYGNLLQPLREVWRDPTNSANILLIYSASSVDASSGWNREHLWPRARGNSEQAG